MGDSLADLSELIASGLQDPSNAARPVLEALFGTRYHKRHLDKTSIRDALKLGNEEGDQGVPFAGFINPDNPESGPYGGTSVVWFPTKESGSLLTFVVGTRGLTSDVGILTRPGHRRRVAALRRMLASQGVAVWSKPDPANLGALMPDSVGKDFQPFDKATKRYGQWLYCVARVPRDNPALARTVVQAFFDLYSYERGWEIMVTFREDRDSLIGHLRQDLFPSVSAASVSERLKARHFVILQGPPGTGKTRLAEEVKQNHFAGKGMTVQFHPAVTYEDFVVGLSPDIHNAESLRFDVRPGWLLQACESGSNEPFLMIIDEINRADLGKILGEAIYLFEPDEVGARTIELAHPVNGSRKFKLPESLHVLGTMNTADRSIANVDLAIRRRFSFMTMMPDRSVIASQHTPAAGFATRFYDRISDVFIEHAPDDALDLMPGHSYYLAQDEDALKKRLRYELLPLLNEYLREGYLGPAASEFNSVRDSLEDAVR